MLLYRNLERLIGTALIDNEFGLSLLSAPATAAIDFGLTDEEMDALCSAHANSLEELAAHIHAWITRAPKPRRANSTRWVGDNSQAARIAV